MTADAYATVIRAPARDRLDLFLATANRLGAPVGNVEKDFWVCWTLDALYHRLPADRPRLLFKGGTSLSKAYRLIERFSEDIDVTVFREISNRRASKSWKPSPGRNAGPASTRSATPAVTNVTGPLRESLAAFLAEAAKGAGRIEIDEADPDRQTLLVWYPEVEPRDDAYVRPGVRIESGAKSALDPNQPVTLRPYIAEETPDLDLSIPDVTTIEAGRTFWDKVVIAHGLRRWYERRGVLRQDGQRISRHYYDLHKLLGSEAGKAALRDLDLARDCVRHARMFFDRTDFDLASAQPGTLALAPVEGMTDALRRDYANTVGMIFGEPPTFDAILDSMRQLEAAANVEAA
jgi:hypothetical protein